MYPTKTEEYVHKKIAPALKIIAQTRGTYPKVHCSWTDGLWSIYTLEHCPTRKTSELLKYTAALMNLKIVVLVHEARRKGVHTGWFHLGKILENSIGRRVLESRLVLVWRWVGQTGAEEELQSDVGRLLEWWMCYWSWFIGCINMSSLSNYILLYRLLYADYRTIKVQTKWND